MQEQTFTILILIILILAYLILGAVVFQQLEAENEQESHDTYYDLFRQLQQRYNISKALMKDVLVTHESACELGLPNAIRKWSFTGSFYFVGSVLTTIGKYREIFTEFNYANFKGVLKQFSEKYIEKKIIFQPTKYIQYIHTQLVN